MTMYQSLLMYTTHSRASDTNIYIHIYIYIYKLYTLNPVESNYKDGPMGHENYL